MDTRTIEKQSTELTLPARAAVALGTAEHEKKLALLTAEAKTITEIKNGAGRDQCHSVMMTLKNARVSIEKSGKAAREDAQAFSKAVIAEEKRLIAITEAEENRLQELRDKWDADREAERNSNQSMFHDAIRDLASINEALGCDPDDGGADPILDAIQQIKAERDLLQAALKVARAGREVFREALTALQSAEPMKFPKIFDFRRYSTLMDEQGIQITFMSEADRDAAFVALKQIKDRPIPPQPSAERNVRHVGECAHDEHARQVCDGIYQERVDNILELCEALRAVYALCGESEEVKNIVESAIQQHGV